MTEIDRACTVFLNCENNYHAVLRSFCKTNWFIFRLTFTILYTIEMAIKMIARGVIINPFSYLRDPWNWLDFIVVILA